MEGIRTIWKMTNEGSLKIRSTGKIECTMAAKTGPAKLRDFYTKRDGTHLSDDYGDCSGNKCKWQSTVRRTNIH